MSSFINLKLLLNPVNWVVVALMLTIGGFGLALILEHVKNPDSDK